MALLGGLAGCSSPPPPAPVAPPGPPVPIDGTYGGLMTLTRGLPGNCGNQNEFTLQVVNGAFSFRMNQGSVDWRPYVTYNGVIRPDGSFNVEAGPDFMRGRVAGGHMQGDLEDDACGYVFNADRNGTW
jgi:hypothetical protein